MTQEHIRTGTPVEAAVHAAITEVPYATYRVGRHDDLWFIRFDGSDYGPYVSEREAMLFAVDAAHKLGEQGQPTQVQMIDENGEEQLVWTYGRDPFPPRI